ncbi:MAG: hypothetical protein FWD62_10345 [Betaproteobacteria bacterium]|nr:hypothetical protein [Betaproteobacteria bacterium]
MSDHNPYQPPSVVVQDSELPHENENFIPEGRTVDAGHGISWLTGGFKMVLAQFVPWLLITIVILVVMFIIGMIPLVNLLSNLIFPVLFGGILIGAQRQAQGGTIEVGDVFAGFKEKAGPLIIIGILTLVMSLVLFGIVIVFFGFSLFTAFATHNQQAIFASMGSLFLAIPVILVLGMLITACWWLAPALVVFHDVPPVEAMKRSFSASLRNWAPVLIYGVLATIALVVGMIPLGLGLLLVWPALLAATYVAYRDIFIEG